MLGEQRVSYDGRGGGALQGRRALGLLAYLVLHAGAPQPRSRLAGLFWPDSGQAQARTNLRRELHQLRLNMPDIDSYLDFNAASVCWRPGAPARVDLLEFEQLAELARQAGNSERFRPLAAHALGAYAGELLPDFDEDWVLPDRERLRRRAIELLDQLAATERKAGNLAAAVDWARRRVELEPLDESGYRQLIELTSAAGDRAASIRVYHRCVSVLENELQVPPDRRTTALYERLLTAPETPTQPSRTGRTPLVGRAVELATLLQTWRAIRPGQPKFVLVTGGPGLGKSRLVAELATGVRQESGMLLPARCFVGGDKLALAPVSEWLRNPQLTALRSRLEPVWQAEVERLVPTGPARTGTGQHALADGWQRYRFFEGLARAVLIARRPTLLVLEDLQWCDSDTLTWLQLLLRLRARTPLLVVATARLEELQADPELAAALDQLRSARVLDLLPLDPLSQVDTGILAGHAIGRRIGAEDTASLHAVTGGNPLLVLETVRGSAAGSPVVGPGAASSVLTARLAGLSAAGRDVCELAAAVGQDFSLELLEQASDLEPAVVVDAVDELWRRGLLREHQTNTYDFSHDLLRETAYAAISAPRLRLLHRRIAQALELLYGDAADQVAATLAEHYRRAGRAEAAVRWHARAAKEASRVFANDVAVEHYARARELLAGTRATRDRDAIELDLCYRESEPLNALRGYASVTVQRGLERACVLAERLGEERILLGSLIGLWAVRFVQGRTATSYEIGHRALALGDAAPDLVGQAHLAVGGSATSLGRLDEALHHLGLAQRLCADAAPVVFGTRGEVHARAWSAHALWLTGDEAGALTAADEAIAWAKAANHPYSTLVALGYGAITRQLTGDIGGTAEMADAVLAICARFGYAYYLHWGEVLAAWARPGRDRIPRMQTALATLRRSGAHARQPYYLSLLADALHAEGQTERARAVLVAARATAVAHDDLWWLPALYRQSSGYEVDEHTATRFLRAAAELSSPMLADRAFADLTALRR